MPIRTPRKLSQDPIVEAIFEVRFETDTPPADLMAGVLYGSLRKLFPKFERLPIADLPKQFLEFAPAFRYQPRVKLTGDQFALLVGDRSCILSCPKPYAGWETYRQVIFSVLAEIKKADLAKSVERFSLKYANLLSAKDLGEQFSLLRFSARLGDHDLAGILTNIRTEIIVGTTINIVEIQPGVTTAGTTNAEQSPTGMMLSVDSIERNVEGFWDKYTQRLDDLHSVEKTTFFGILTDAAIDRFGPIW